jgi:hypothetical protein
MHIQMNEKEAPWKLVGDRNVAVAGIVTPIRLSAD